MNNDAIITITDAKVRQNWIILKKICEIFLLTLPYLTYIKKNNWLHPFRYSQLSIINVQLSTFNFQLSTYYSFGPAATSALPASLPSYFLKFLMKRAARSSAFLFHSAASA